MRINSCPVKCNRNVDESGHFVDCLNAKSSEERVVYKGLNSTER